MPPTPRPHGPKKKKSTVPLPSSRGRMPAAGGRSLPKPLLLGAAGLAALIVVAAIFASTGAAGAAAMHPRS